MITISHPKQNALLIKSILDQDNYALCTITDAGNLWVLARFEEIKEARKAAGLLRRLADTAALSEKDVLVRLGSDYEDHGQATT